jgi:outer membrane receptor for monomeric catechols
VTPIIVSIPFTRRLLASDFPRPPTYDKFTNRTVDRNNILNWSNLRFTQFITSENQRTTAMWGVAYGEGETISIDNRAGGRSRGEGSDTTYTVGGTHAIMSNADVKVTLFGNYSTSFLIQPGNQQDPSQFLGFATVAELTAFTLSRQPNPVEPQTGSGFETGIRFDFPKQKLQLELAYFDQSRENIARSFFVRRSLAANSTDEQVIATFQLASGEEQVSGLDVTLAWNPNNKLSLTAGAAIMNGVVVSNPEVPQEVGLGLINLPETQIEFWGLYSFGKAKNRGFSLGLGASYNTGANVFPTYPDRWRFSDEYIMARALLRYDYKLGRYNHTVSLNIDNLLDQEFTYEADQLSEPRIYKLTYNIGW